MRDSYIDNNLTDYYSTIFNFVTYQLQDLHFIFYSLPSDDPQLSWARGLPSAKSSPEGAKGKGSPYSITEHRVPEPIPVLGSQPAGDLSHKPGGRLPLLSARPAVYLPSDDPQLRWAGGLPPAIFSHE